MLQLLNGRVVKMEGITSLPVTGMVNGRGDAMRVMGREAEAVVLLEILIGSHTERK